VRDPARCQLVLAPTRIRALRPTSGTASARRRRACVAWVGSGISAILVPPLSEALAVRLENVFGEDMRTTLF
jgi:hypothetical protein